MPKRVTEAILYFLCGITVVALLFSLYMQYVQGLEPCPLCAMQRACVVALLGCSLTALLVQGDQLRRYLVALQLVFSLCGLYFALRQLWLQSLPTPHEAICLPGLELLARYLPWRDLVQLLFWGSPACNEVLWQAFGFSMAAWSALFFSTSAAGVIWLLVYFHRGKVRLRRQ